MTKIVMNARVGHWVAAQMGAVYAPEQSSAIGLERNGQIVAGIFYENFNGKSMLAHIAIQGQATAEFFRVNADYVFHQCKIHKLIATVSSGNSPSRRLLVKMGFVEECRIRDADPAGDILIFTITERDCRFLKGRYRGQALSSAIA